MDQADDDDDALVRALVARGALDEGSARACLVEARRRRAAGASSSVARVLAERRLVDADLLQRALVEVVQRGDTLSARPASSHGSFARAQPPSALNSGTMALPPSHAGGSGAGARGRAPARVAPERLGDYRLTRLLARGGMGAVYEAVHEPSGTVRAVKLLLRSGPGADPEEVQRFRREAELMARLDHPHVARVHAADLEADPAYLVQDLLPGGSLQDQLKREGPLPCDEVVDLGRKLAGAVAHAHARGVLHRDLKPANVLRDDRGEPRLTDFGLSRRAGAGSIALTATGQVLGTPAYMAPEQALGGGQVDARADVYGLGAVLYAALVGHEPFVGKSVTEVLERVLREEPARPSRLRPDVPAGLEAVVLRAMAKDPAARFPSAEALGAALDALAAPAARGRARAGRASAPSGATKLLAGAAGAAVLLGAVALWSAGSPAPRPEPAPTSVAPEPSPAPTTPAASTTPTASPPPTQTASEAAPRRWWGLTPGGAYDAALTLCAECPGVGAPRMSASLLLALEVGAPAPDGRASLTATVRRVRVQVRGPLFELDHDGATRKGDLPEVRRAFEAVVGQRLGLEVDPASGAARVEGGARLREAVLLAAPDLPARPEDTRGWALRAFADSFEGTALASALSAMFEARAPGRFEGGRLVSGLVEERLALGGREVQAARSWQEVRARVVARGETLGRLAAEDGLAFPVLAMLNGIDDPDLIREGAVLERPRAAPAAPRRAVEVRADQVVARDRPWGHAVATLPAGLRFVSDAEDLGWVRFDFAGGWAWLPADALGPAPGAVVVEVHTSQQVARVERAGSRRFASRGQAYVVVEAGGALTRIQFDQAPADMRADSLRRVELSAGR